MKKIFDFKTAIAIIGITIPVVLFIISKNVKELSFKNVAINELISGRDLPDESIKVYFDQQQVLNLYSISCIIYNSGNLPITKEDIINGLSLDFPDSTKILKYSIKMNPETIVVHEPTISGGKFSLLPDLLNPNENIELSFYISSNTPELLPQSKSRIIGGKVINLNMNEEIKSKTSFTNKAFAYFEGPIFWTAFIYTILYILLVSFSVYFQKDIGLKTPIGKFFTLLFLCLGLLCNLFYLIQTRF